MCAAGCQLHACKNVFECVCVCVDEGLEAGGGRGGCNSYICDHLPNETGGLR